MSFVVITKVKYPALAKQEIHDAGLKMLAIAKQQSGFISIAFHQSTDSDDTMTVWEWDSQTDHEACMTSDVMVGLMEQSKPVFEQDGIEFSMETFERLA